MRNTTKIFFAFFLISCLSFPLFAEEISLLYERYPEKGLKSFRPYSSCRLETYTKLPSGVWKLPALKSELPVYAFAMLGDAKLLMVLDRKDKGDSFYSRIYFDANGNQDLTDDPPIDSPSPDTGASLRSRPNYATFPVVDITMPLNKAEVPYSFLIRIYYVGQAKETERTQKDLEEKFYCYFSPNCSYKGAFQHNGEKFRFILFDGNGNGRFDDNASIPSKNKPAPPLQGNLQGDHFYLTNKEAIEYGDRNHFGKCLILGEKVFRIRINIGKKTLTLEPEAETLVGVQLPLKVERLSLSSLRGAHSVMMYKPVASVRIPPGTYRFTEYQVYRKDEQGDLWFLKAAATPETPLFTAGKNSPPVMQFGEPFSPFAQIVPLPANYPTLPSAVQSSLRQNVRLRFHIEGCAKEKVTDLKHVSGNNTGIPLDQSGARPKEPAYRILNAEGKVVAQGSFKYG